MTGFIGGGNMAEAIIKGMIQSVKASKGQSEIIVSEPRKDRREYLEQTYGVKTTQDNKEVASSCNIIILAVKPQVIEQVLEDIDSAVTNDKTVVSIAAGITLSYLQSKLNTKKLIRVMPNTPALVHEAMSVMSLCECFSDKDINPVREIFMSIGKVLTLPEKYMNAVTALSGSGPAFIALFIEAMIEGGVKSGLSKENASELAIQTLLGTASLLETWMPPERLREIVTSPGGTTAAGLKVFEDKGLKGLVADALQAAKKRAEELGRRE
ncbi:MAG: pyrroline-5-carboxylate reductase [Thermodesulfovibrionales bacterium]|nr:pyrroline-5-carboxylate reductase [Thermodesulfovibrionales bacterium]